MKIATLAAFVAALALPIGASAQVAPQPAPGQGQQRSPGQRQYQHWMRRLSALNLSQQQQSAVQNALNQFASQHPAGSPKDPQAAHALRDQIYSILTPDQVNQLRAEQRAMKQQRQQMQSQQGQYPQGQYQQAPPPQAAGAPPV
jgi:chromosome condensin MukBEF ATPase and DNA-binding subunit MukB